MRPDYKKWLEDEKYSANTIVSQLHRAGRVEESYGDLEVLHNSGKLQSVIDELTYSAEDERRNKPNPSKIPFDGNIRNNLSSYKNAVVRYRKFLTVGWERSDVDLPPEEGSQTVPVKRLADQNEGTVQKLSLERNMQASLRRDIKKLGETVSITDDGE